MPGTVKPVPEGHRTVAPYLAIKDAAAALDFYAKAFGATETYRLAVPDASATRRSASATRWSC